MSKLTAKDRERLQALASQSDRKIDTSDIPEVRQLPTGAVIGKFYRPVKQSVTIRLDADVLDWLKGSGGGYQTRINTYLREAMRKQKAS
ncbi:MAG TPA: BrnA antitoxin family protein [Bryobacteraceae bacterium]|nr:BrnA antitoxin family protein [Bryobacteraceae bacterium]